MWLYKVELSASVNVEGEGGVKKNYHIRVENFVYQTFQVFI